MAIVTLFLMSLFGSPHCAAMCGGFVTSYSTEKLPAWQLHIAYNGGRLLTYLSLGALAGYLGSSLNKIGFLVGVANISATLLGSIFLVWGLNLFLDRPWQALNKISSLFNSIFFSAHSRFGRLLSKSKGLARTFLIGLLSTLLPCGWLYTFAATAGATGSVPSALGTMVIFWCGTLPVMIFIATFSQRILQRWSLETSKITASLLIVAGLLTISGHLGIAKFSAPGETDPQLQCH